MVFNHFKCQCVSRYVESFTVITGNVNIAHEKRIILSLLKMNEAFKRHLNNVIDTIHVLLLLVGPEVVRQLD